MAKTPAQQDRKLKLIGGSASDDWNNVLANQTLNTLWVKPLQVTGDAERSLPDARRKVTRRSEG